MKHEFDAVIFDMDGLLVDSERVWMICESAMLARRGKVWDKNIQQKLIGMRMNDFLAGMIREYGLTDDADVLEKEVLDQMCGLVGEKVVANPGAAELIAYLAEAGIPCSIASSSPLVVIHSIVETQGWSDYFPVRVSGEEVAQGKPSPDVYVETAQRMGVSPHRCLALEDSPNGARAAVAAGMTCYAVPDRWHTSPDMFDGVTPYVFDSLHDVLTHLRG